jgi:hypothetical protein
MSICLFVNNNNNSYERFRKRLIKYCDKNNISVLLYPEDKEKIIEVYRERREDIYCKYGKMIVLVDEYTRDMWSSVSDIHSLYLVLPHVGISLLLKIDRLSDLNEAQSWDTRYLIHLIGKSLKIIKYTTREISSKMSVIFK